MANKKKDEPEARQSGLFAERAALMGQTTQGVVAADLDARLLYWVVCVLAERHASIQIGVTKDGGSYAVQYWDGVLPIKEYFSSSEQLNTSWAGLLRAAYKRSAPPEIEEVIRSYGW